MAKTSMKVKQQRPQKFSTREYTRCKLCGRPHSVLRKYGIRDEVSLILNDFETYLKEEFGAEGFSYSPPSEGTTYAEKCKRTLQSSCNSSYRTNKTNNRNGSRWGKL